MVRALLPVSLLLLFACDDKGGDGGTDADADGTTVDDGDCDDASAAVHPGAPEVCNGLDDDCDGQIDDADDDVDLSTGGLWFTDDDDDGFGRTDAPVAACEAPPGAAADDGDCDDTDPAIHPGATEVCDADDTDEDCSGAADDADPGVDPSSRRTWYADDDGDGYGDQDDLGERWCDAPSGRVDDRSDCDDRDAAVHPAATEICDDADNDCDDAFDQWGTVSFTDASGVTTDVTSTFSGGTSGSPNTIAATAAGSYNFCDGTWYANLTISADVDLVVVEGAPVIDGGDTDHVLAVQTDGITVNVGEITLQNGAADTVSALGYTAGGAVVCDATATMAFDQTDLSSSTADVGGGLATTDCTITLTAASVSSNVANEAGGGVFVSGSGSVTLQQGSGVTQNDAPYGGGLYLYDTGTIALIDATVAANEAQQGGGAFVNGVSGTPTLTCEGSASQTRGFIQNTSSSTDGAVFLTASGGGIDFEAIECDFGRVAPNTDNDAVGLTNTDAGWIYGVGDDATFTCDTDGCGDTDTLDVGGADTNASGDDRAIGNIFTGTAEGVIDGFTFTLDPDSSCSLDYYVLSNASLSSSGWTVEWSSMGHSGSGAGDYGPTSAGVGVHAGTTYATVAAWTCATSGHSVGFAMQPDSTTPVDLAFATHEGTVQTAYSTAWANIGNSVTVTTTTAQYQGTVTATQL